MRAVANSASVVIVISPFISHLPFHDEQPDTALSLPACLGSYSCSSSGSYGPSIPITLK
jgi:hypothetical protein